MVYSRDTTDNVGDHMKKKFNMFMKMTVLVSLLLIAIIVMYSYSYYTSVTVVKDEITARNMNRLVNSMEKIDTHAQDFTDQLVTLSLDSDIVKFKNNRMYSGYDQLETKQTIMEKLHLQSVMSSWNTDVFVYEVETEEAIGTKSLEYDETYLSNNVAPGWGYFEGEHLKSSYFSTFIISPYHYAYELEQTQLIIEGRFYITNLVQLLNDLKESLIGDPFIYHPMSSVVSNRTADEEVISLILDKLENYELDDKGEMTLDFHDEPYLVTYVKSPEFDWILFDYVPVNDVLSPIDMIKNIFYTSIFLLLLLCVGVMMLFYRHLQRPLDQLMYGMEKVRGGDYSIRLTSNKKNEFEYLHHGFNEMAFQTEYLIETVYKEKQRFTEAKLKQLQSQINPHFLYNCLFFIKNMAKLGRTKPVEEMSLLLGEYYRYTTHTDTEIVSLKEELDLIQKYIAIHALRMKNFSYEVALSQEVEDVKVPKLLIQPIVENALVHGLEPNQDKSELRLEAEIVHGRVTITIEDNGVGIQDEEKLASLRDKLTFNKKKNASCGLSNVNQRLKFHYGEGAQMEFKQKPLGGIKVRLSWSSKL